MKPIPEQLSLIKRGVVELITEKELAAKLKKGKPLRIKAGFDPTAPDLHLGHTVLLNKLRQFQELGHQVIFLIGDFTGMVGDPSGVSETRKVMTAEQVKENAGTYESQVFKILDRKKTEVVFNSEWLGKMPPIEFAQMGSKFTVARMMERDDFKMRFKSGQDISILEFYYPLMQGYDSVHLKADVELGGTDQKFNLLMGRTLQKRYGQESQVVLTLPLLEGIDGIRKMSKSYGNYIGIDEPPKDIFGKIMSISDSLMWRYYELLSAKETSEIESMKKKVEEGALHPKEVKVNLAREMVARFHSEKEAEKAAVEFESVFKGGALPDEVEEFSLPAGTGKVGLLSLMTQAGLTPSNSEARRMVVQGGVKLNQQKVSDPQIQLPANGEYLLQVGKRKVKKIKFL
ncbi:MAG: tyrosine--tRNA ligase [Deltaproteobacteria bacterium]|nr:tyrosine--tRNA ligase [Deltaproteobacteria bacterium]